MTEEDYPGCPVCAIIMLTITTPITSVVSDKTSASKPSEEGDDSTKLPYNCLSHQA